MRRYLPLLLISFFLVVTFLAGSFYLAGYAGKAEPKNINSITVYTTLPVEQVVILAEEYEKLQKGKVNIVPLNGQELLERLKNEAGSPKGDMILATESTLEQAKRNHLLTSCLSVHTDIIPKRFLDNNGYWIGLWYDPIVFVENKDFVRDALKAPCQWSDLVKDNKIRIGITDFLAAESAANLLYSMVETYGEEQTMAYWKRIHPQIVQYSKFLVTPVRMTCLRETDVSIVVQSEALRYVSDNFPVKVIYPDEGTSYLLTGAGLVQGAARTNEAQEFIDWLCQDEAQSILFRNKYYFVPTNPETLVYQDYAGKLKLFEQAEARLPVDEQKKVLDKWAQMVRFK